MGEDHVDRVLAQWRRERPDVDLSGMALIGRVSRAERRIRPRLNACFAEHGLESWEFDVLATLRRAGAPHRLTAGQLLDWMMITSGAITHRINRLEARGYVRREPDPSDGRVVWVVLTDDGRAVIDDALTAHAANEVAIISVLGERDRTALTRLLRKLHLALDEADGQP
jgi:DNA-binding MarR family transcriptional regulator